MEKLGEDVLREDVRVYGGDEFDEFHLGHEVSENISSGDDREQEDEILN